MLEGKDIVGAREGDALLVQKAPWYRNGLSSCQTAPKEQKMLHSP